jgi:hypothetical protein
MPKKSKSGRPAPILVPAGLKLNGPFWEIVRAAFKRYGVNPNDLADWRALLWCLACGVSHGRCIDFQMAEVAIPRRMFQEILRLIAELRLKPPPAPA